MIAGVRFRRRHALALLGVLSALASVLVLVESKSAYRSEAAERPPASSSTVEACSGMWDCTSSRASATSTPTSLTGTPTSTNRISSSLTGTPTSTSGIPTSPNNLVAPTDNDETIAWLLQVLLFIAGISIVAMLVRAMTNRRRGPDSEHVSGEHPPAA